MYFIEKNDSFNCVGNTFDSEITDNKKHRSAQSLRTNAFFKALLAKTVRVVTGTK